MIERHTFGSKPLISVVIPTIPESSHSSVVSNLKSQKTDFNYEIIVINNADLDICEARNEGVRQADSDIIALTDDDCRPPQQWLSTIYQTYMESPEDLCCVEGSVRGGLNYSGYRHYVGCNLTFDRKQAMKIDGFDSEFAGYRDDTEFGWRMEKNAEGSCKFEESIKMVHPQRPRSNFNAELDSKLQSRYPERYDTIFNQNIQEKIYLKLARMGVIGTFNQMYNQVLSGYKRL